MKNRTFLSLLVVLSVALMTSTYAAQSKPAAGGQKSAASPQSIENGAALFKRHCVMCHGATGQGDGPASKTLKGKLPSLADKATMSKLTDEHIHETITNGKKSEIGNMPALGKRLKPEEITDVVNYVRTLSK